MFPARNLNIFEQLANLQRQIERIQTITSPATGVGYTDGLKNPMTDYGDMIAGATNGVATNLPVGGSNQVLVSQTIGGYTYPAWLTIQKQVWSPVSSLYNGSSWVAISQAYGANLVNNNYTGYANLRVPSTGIFHSLNNVGIIFITNAALTPFYITVQVHIFHEDSTAYIPSTETFYQTSAGTLTLMNIDITSHVDAIYTAHSSSMERGDLLDVRITAYNSSYPLFFTGAYLIYD
jgi:hypothetical protein